MTTTRALRDEIVNVLAYLSNAGLIGYYNQVYFDKRIVSWTGMCADEPFIPHRGEPTVETYRHWVRSNAYTAQLFDGALLQIGYRIERGTVTGHRLAYVPCPFVLDRDLIELGEPLDDLIDLYLDSDPTKVVLHSIVRFDYDPDSSAPGHPSSHLTLNTPDCRIACSAPMHVGRFVDFVFRHFYRSCWLRNAEYFTSIAKNIGRKVITEEEISTPHLHWV